MWEFIQSLRLKNETLFIFGLINFLLAALFFVLSKYTDTRVYNVSAWYKPLKFALSIGIFSWTMAWYCSYLPSFNLKLFNWSVVFLFGFEIIYIALQAGRGQLSHFNISTPMYSVLYFLMAFASTAVTIYTAYIGLLFFQK